MEKTYYLMATIDLLAFTDTLQTDFYFHRITLCFVKNLLLLAVIVMPVSIKTSHLYETKKKIFKPIVKERNTQFVRLAEPSVITTSTDAREWKDQSSKRQIDMSLIRHDGHVLSSRKRCIRTHAHSPRSHTHVHANFAASASAPSLFARAHFVCIGVCTRVRVRARARLVAYIIVRLISVINILRTAITRGSACSRDINYGCDCGDGCIVRGEGK